MKKDSKCNWNHWWQLFSIQKGLKECASRCNSFLWKIYFFFLEIPQGIVIKKLEHIRTTLDVLHPLFFDSRKYHTSISWMRYWEIKYRTKDYVRFYWFFRRIIWFFWLIDNSMVGQLQCLWWLGNYEFEDRVCFFGKNPIIWRRLGRIKCNWKIDLVFVHALVKTFFGTNSSIVQCKRQQIAFVSRNTKIILQSNQIIMIVFNLQVQNDMEYSAHCTNPKRAKIFS